MMAVDGTYEEGRAEGLAVALLAILDQIAELDSREHPKATVDNVAGYATTNIKWRTCVALRKISVAVQEGTEK